MVFVGFQHEIVSLDLKVTSATKLFFAIFSSKNILSANNETCKNLKNLIRKSDIVILRGDKDSSVVIMNRSDYIQKLEGMIEQGVKKGTYK